MHMNNQRDSLGRVSRCMGEHSSKVCCVLSRAAAIQLTLDDSTDIFFHLDFKWNCKFKQVLKGCLTGHQIIVIIVIDLVTVKVLSAAGRPSYQKVLLITGNDQQATVAETDRE